MAVKIPQYEDRLTPNGFGVVPQARGVEISGAEGQAMQNLGNAGQRLAGVQMHIMKQQQYELDQNDWSNNYATAVIDWNDRQQKAAESAPAGAPGFEETTKKEFEGWAAETLKSVSNADSRVKNQAIEQINRLRVQVVGGAQSFELKSRTDKAINDGQDTEFKWNKTVAEKPDLATFNAAKEAIATMYANSPLDPNLKHDYTFKAVANLAITAYKSAIANPERAGAALNELKALLGQIPVTPEQAAYLKSQNITPGSVETPSAPAAGGAAGGGFGRAVAFTLQAEGGYAGRDANGAEVNMGINAKANPDVDVKNLTKDKATEIYKSRYWDAINGDALAAKNPGLAMIAFDTAAIAGVGKAKELLAKSGDDPAKFMELRREFLQGLIVKNPEKYGRFEKAWTTRNANLEKQAMGASTAPDMAGVGNGTAPMRTETLNPAQVATIDANLQGIGQYLPSNAVFDLLGNAQTAVNQQNALWKSQFDQRVQDASASLMESGSYTGEPITQADFERRNPGQGAQLYAEYGKIEQLGKDVQQVKAMSVEDQQRLLEAYTPTTGEGAEAAIKRRDILAKAVATVNKQRADDPAGYVLRSSTFVKQAADELTKSQTGTIDQQRAAAANYATATIAEQQRLGIAAPRLLTDGQAMTIGAQFRQQMDGGNNAAQLMKQMATVWGKNWPQVFGEIYKDLPPVAQVLGTLGPSVDAATSALIIQTAGMKAEDLKTGLPTTDVKTISEKTQEQFAGFQRTMSWQVGGTTQFALLYNAAEKLAYVYAKEGASPADAAARAFNNTIGRNYNIQDNVRVPKQYDIKAVLKGADERFAGLAKMDLALPAAIPKGMREKDAQAQYADGLKSAGVWVTAGDESGLVLYDSVARTPVRTKGGRDVKFTWAQLMQRPKTGAGLAGNAVNPEPFFGAP